jgi:hypothetical protein
MFCEEIKLYCHGREEEPELASLGECMQIRPSTRITNKFRGNLFFWCACN